MTECKEINVLLLGNDNFKTNFQNSTTSLFGEVCRFTKTIKEQNSFIVSHHKDTRTNKKFILWNYNCKDEINLMGLKKKESVFNIVLIFLDVKEKETLLKDLNWYGQFTKSQLCPTVLMHCCSCSYPLIDTDDWNMYSLLLHSQRYDIFSSPNEFKFMIYERDNTSQDKWLGIISDASESEDVVGLTIEDVLSNVCLLWCCFLCLSSI
jgi:hypothetical protein